MSTHASARAGLRTHARAECAPVTCHTCSAARNHKRKGTQARRQQLRQQCAATDTETDRHRHM
eukprot:9090339-Alexandrium_andersonii.AAC.1